MNSQTPIDVLVVGLGPAGAAAAAAASAAGLRVIAIDRKEKAGLPVQCAEFVPAMTGSMLEAGQLALIGASRRQTITSMTTFVAGDAPHLKEHFPGQMIDRVAFDAALVAAAMSAGAICRFGQIVDKIDERGVAHIAGGIRIAAKVIIGADGPRSTVGRGIGQVNRDIAETRQISVPLLAASTSTDIFLSAGIPGGYAWLFPKGKTANLGLGIEPAQRMRLKPLLEDLHRQLVAEGRVGQRILRTTGGAIPVGGMLAPHGWIGEALVLLAGDACGLTNPVTGAGINAALISGRLAGEAAASFIGRHEDAVTAYHDELVDLFEVSLDRAIERREALLNTYATSSGPTVSDFHRGWIAFPEFWTAFSQPHQSFTTEKTP